MNSDTQRSSRVTETVSTAAHLLLFAGLVILSPYFSSSADAILGPTIVGAIPPIVPAILILISIGMALFVRWTR
jgi:uncharacterized protein (UPF0210 family)